MDDNAPHPTDGIFRPPSHLLKSSQARQAKIKAIREGRDKVDGEVGVADSSDASAGPTPGEATATSAEPQTLSNINTQSVSGSGRNVDHEGLGLGDMTGMAATTPTSVSSPYSRAANNVQLIKQNREERRALAAEVRRMRQGLDTSEQDVLAYRQMIDQFREAHGSEWKAVAAKDASVDAVPISADELIRVCVRKRPLNAREIESSQFDVVSLPPGASRHPDAKLYVHEPKQKLDLSKGLDTHQFLFDTVFDVDCDNADVYRETMKPLVQVLFRPQGRATCFAYGQTGSGKTFTVFGSPQHVQPRVCGIFEYATRDIFDRLLQHNRNASSTESALPVLQLSVSFFEIYGGRVFDLFNQRQRITLLETKQGQMHVGGMVEMEPTSVDEVMQWKDVGERARSTGATDANPESSRSHAIFRITLRDVTTEPGDSAYGQLSFIDLAGSERASEANASNPQTRLEGAEINKSLLALKECIRALNTPSAKHVPFRASKLTQVLRDSLQVTRSAGAAASGSGGSKPNSRQGSSHSLSEMNRAVVMVATVGPNSTSVEHTLNTLRYANRVKEIKGGNRGGSAAVETERVHYDPYAMVHSNSAHDDDDNLETSGATDTPPRVVKQQPPQKQVAPPPPQRPVAQPSQQQPAQPSRKPSQPKTTAAPSTSSTPLKSRGGKSVTSPAATSPVMAVMPRNVSPVASRPPKMRTTSPPMYHTPRSNSQRTTSPPMSHSARSNSIESDFNGMRVSPVDHRRDGNVSPVDHRRDGHISPVDRVHGGTNAHTRGSSTEFHQQSNADFDYVDTTIDLVDASYSEENRQLAHLQEEEDHLVHAHLHSLRRMLDLSRAEEEQLLAEVSRPGYDVAGYVARLETALDHKAMLIRDLQIRVANFKRNMAAFNGRHQPASSGQRGDQRDAQRDADEFY